MQKRIVCSVLIMSMLFSAFSFACRGDNRISVDSSAKSAVLMDSQSGELIFSKNENEKLPIASTTKIMTAIIVLGNTTLDTVISVDKRACGIEGSSAYLSEGAEVSIEDLLYALMLQSANDAAVALALYVGEGEAENFVSLMNEKAKMLGMKNSHFENPHGLCEDGHYSSAYDMALLMRYAMQNELFGKITSTYKYHSKALNSSFVNHNRLLKSLKGCIGGKTGFTKKSGRCLVSTAERDGCEFICVTLSCPDDWQEHTAMYEKAFSDYCGYELVTRGQYGFCLPVVNSDCDTLYAEAEYTKALIKKSDTDKIKAKTHLHRFYYAGIEKGEKVGEMIFYLDDKEIAKSDILATNSCDNISYKNIFEKLLSFFIKD